MNPIVIIPARLASTRLPDKPLADIGGAPMIVQVVRRAEEAALGPVLVAAGDPEIVKAVEAAGARAILTDPDLPSGSDRIWAALSEADPDGVHDVVVNLQGDLPTISKAVLAAIMEPLADEAVDISTLVAKIQDEDEKSNPNVVKAVLALPPGEQAGRALYFTRATAPTGEGPLYHHIGIYGYRRSALKRFVSLSPSPLEVRERLEQLRALEDGMIVGARVVDEVPAGVDTPEDLEKARQEISQFK